MTEAKRYEAVAITRYDPANGYDSTMRPCAGLVENAFGIAVRYSDHATTVTALDARVAELEGEVGRLRAEVQEYKVALVRCKQISTERWRLLIEGKST